MAISRKKAWYYTVSKGKEQDHPRWQEYNDGHSVIRGCGEHLFAQLYT